METSSAASDVNKTKIGRPDLLRIRSHRTYKHKSTRAYVHFPSEKTGSESEASGRLSADATVGWSPRVVRNPTSCYKLYPRTVRSIEHNIKNARGLGPGPPTQAHPKARACLRTLHPQESTRTQERGLPAAGVPTRPLPMRPLGSCRPCCGIVLPLISDKLKLVFC